MVIELPDWMGLRGLPWLYTAAQMHLHWGSGGPGHGGSEHTVDGESTDAEVALGRGFLQRSMEPCGTLSKDLNGAVKDLAACRIL